MISLLLLACSCNTKKPDAEVIVQTASITKPSLMVLGTVQDGGSPHAACTKSCCADGFNNKGLKKYVVSLGLIDTENKKTFLVEATPDLVCQIKSLKQSSSSNSEAPDGILLTHAHIGHYAGLMYLGREAMNAREVPVFAMPKMKQFLETNGPWSQLVSLKNILLRPLQDSTKTTLSAAFNVEALRVPHRDEFSETVGYIINGPNKKVLFIPDIDKWEKWYRDIRELIKEVDYAFIDGTFYDAGEVNNRNIKEIPHPFIVESMALFESLPMAEKNKIYFIHFNHTNPLLNEESRETQLVLKAGYHIARQGLIIVL